MFTLEASRAKWALIAGGGLVVFASSLAVGRAQPSAVPSPQSAVSAQPESKLSSLELGDALMYHKRYQAAIAAYANEPQKTANLWNRMGIAYQMMFNLVDATRCYKASLKLSPSDPNVLNNLGTALQSLGDFGQAEKMYRKAVQLDPKFALAYKNLATCLMARRKYKQGRVADAQALALDPTVFEPGNGKGLTIDNPASVHDRGAMNYYMAVDCVRARQTACALEHLRLALDQGYISSGKVAADSNFNALSSDPRFQQLLADHTGK